MITILSRTGQFIRGNNVFEPGQIFMVKIPDSDVITLDFTEEERALIRRAQEDNDDLSLVMKVLTMIVEKVEGKKPITDGFLKSTLDKDIKQLYVDHLTTDLEKRSIFDIVVFLSRYCGWNTIRDQIEEHIRSLEKGANHE